MDYFGDVSGDLRGLLNGDSEVVVVGIVGGDRISCGRCAKKAVRRVDDIQEAKWNDLTDVQKRRLFECFAEQDRLEFGYVIYDRQRLHSMDEYHYLYQNVSFPPDWDLALTGYAYGELLFEMDVTDDQRSTFTFDRVASKAQSKAVKNHVEEYVPATNVFIEGSQQSSGIQAADCLAGGVAEDMKRDTDWLDYLDGADVTTASYTSLMKLETRLGEL